MDRTQLVYCESQLFPLCQLFFVVTLIVFEKIIFEHLRNQKSDYICVDNLRKFIGILKHTINRLRGRKT